MVKERKGDQFEEGDKIERGLAPFRVNPQDEPPLATHSPLITRRLAWGMD
jgi:hypothetical protein